MQIEISVRHGQLSADAQERISEKVSKLPRLWDRITAIYVTADMEHDDSPAVETRVSVEHANDFVAAGQAPTVLAALDGALHKLEQQLRKHKEKRTGHKAAGLKNISVPQPPADSEAP